MCRRQPERTRRGAIALDDMFVLCSFQRNGTLSEQEKLMIPGMTGGRTRSRLFKDALTLALLFGTVYVGALLGHGYGL
jgi:hypothetical protein